MLAVEVHRRRARMPERLRVGLYRHGLELQPLFRAIDRRLRVGLLDRVLRAGECWLVPVAETMYAPGLSCTTPVLVVQADTMTTAMNVGLRRKYMARAPVLVGLLRLLYNRGGRVDIGRVVLVEAHKHQVVLARRPPTGRARASGSI
jgi:hypothetical protein